MESRNLNPRAVLFDVYSTLLLVGPPPADAEIRWQKLWTAALPQPPRWSRLEFSAACSQVIAQRHAEARSRGITWPEIQWPSVVGELIPELRHLSEADREEFIYAHIQTGRTLRLDPTAAATLQWLARRGITLGIASNSQAYTLRELESELARHALSLEIFQPDLCFWSFQHGFSKPDPHVFQVLAARLEARGIAPAEVMMVGDRSDNDIQPAQCFGWQTWHLTASDAPNGGPWASLLTRLQSGHL